MNVAMRNLMLVVLMLAAAGPARAEWQVWTVTQTRRVLRDEPAGKQVAVNLGAAKNEWEGFQVLLRCDQSVEGVRVEPRDLTGPEGAVLRGADAVVYRQHQLELATGSYRNAEFKPGWYPDPLIPTRHPLTGQPLESGRLVAQPFDLPAEQTHGFWIDIFVPPEAKAGPYRGTCRVTARSGTCVDVPITLTIWDFALPRVSTFQTALGSPAERMHGYYQKRAKAGKEKEPADWSAVEAQCALLLSQHRINASPPAHCLRPVAQPDGSFRIPAEQIQALRQFVDQYHVNAIDIPHPRSVVKDPDQQREKLRAWLAAWDRAAAELDRPYVTFYTYLKDEPNDEEAYHYVQKWGRAIQAAKTVVKVLVVEQTWPQDPAWGDLYGAVDIWCPLFPLHKQDDAAKRQALGETIWTYTALCQGKQPSPWWQIDFPLLNYRVPVWTAWGYGMRGILYWGGMSYWSGVDDPWTDPKTLDRRKGGKGQLYNGEGTIVYPGRAVGYDGIAPSLRLKALRDAIEDYEYMAIAQRLGRAAEARKIVAALTDSFFQWQPDPAAYQRARAALAELIVGPAKHRP